MDNKIFIKPEPFITVGCNQELLNVEGDNYIKIDTIVSCHAIDQYCSIFLNNGNKHIVYKSLGEVSEMLPQHKFIKIHSGQLVNIDFVNRYVKSVIDYVVLHDGRKIDIGSKMRKAVMKTFNIN